MFRQVKITYQNQALYISGAVDEEYHAWNIVQLNDGYYHVDTTWGETIIATRETNNKKRYTYDFLLMNDSMIADTHVLEKYYHYPTCNEMVMIMNKFQQI